MDNLLRLAITLIAAFFGTIFANYLNRRKEKVSLTLEFKREFNNDTFSKHRRTAHNLIRKHPEKSFEELSEVDEERSLSLYVLMRFYENLWVSVEANKIDSKLVYSYFGEIFVYWYFLSFKPNLIGKLDWTIGDKLDEFNTWLKKNMPSKDYEKANKRGLLKFSEFSGSENESK